LLRLRWVLFQELNEHGRRKAMRQEPDSNDCGLGFCRMRLLRRRKARWRGLVCRFGFGFELGMRGLCWRMGMNPVRPVGRVNRHEWRVGWVEEGVRWWKGRMWMIAFWFLGEDKEKGKVVLRERDYLCWSWRRWWWVEKDELFEGESDFGFCWKL